MSSPATKALAPGLVLCLLLGACSDIYFAHRDTIALSTGDALAGDKAIQVVDPWPPGSNDRNIRFNGDRMQAAAARYRTGKIIPPKSPITSSASSTQTQSSTADAPTQQ